MFIQFVALSVLALVASGSHALTTTTQILASDSELAESCIAKFESTTMKDVEVPLMLTKLMQDMRSLHPELKRFSLIKFADSSRVNEEVVETGLVRASELDDLIHLCASFVAKIYPNGETPCDMENFMQNYNTYETFLEVAAKHPEFDTKMGTARFCVQL